MKKENLTWLSGTIAHLHLRHNNEEKDVSPAELRQFTHAMALEYLHLLSGRDDIRITDTNHAMLVFSDLDNLKKPEDEDKQEWINRLTKQASDETLKRINEIREKKNSNLIVGIEADIVGDNGQLSLNEECLSQIDYVVASFHKFIRKVFSEEKLQTSESLIQAYLGVLDNPYVDVLGHSTRLSSDLENKVSIEDYRLVVEKMKEKGVTFEVNIFNDLRSSDEELTLGVVKLCIEYDVPLVMSLDFHQFQDINFLKNLPIEDEIAEEDLELFFKENKDIHFRVFRRIIKNISILEDLGVKKEMVLNSSNEGFDDWLNKRKELKSTFRMTTN